MQFKTLTAQLPQLAAWFILLFTLSPLLLLCFYNVPLGDDFWYAEAFRRQGFLDTQRSFYHDWSGRYMATFLISAANPLSYGYMNLGFIHPLSLLAGTAVSLKFLINTIVDFFELSISKWLSFSIILFFYLNYIPDLGESFYWMAGAYTYQLPVIFVLLYIAILIRMFSARLLAAKIGLAVLAAICLFVILGSNEVIVVYVCCLQGLIALGLLVADKSKFFAFLPLLFLTIGLAYFMIFAEGNFARADLFEKPDYHLLKSLLHSLSRGVFVLVFWIPALLILLLCIPGLSKIAMPQDFTTRYRRNTIVIASVSVLVMIVLVGFFPSIYTTRWIPQRAYTPIFLVFIIAFTVIVMLLMRYFPTLAALNGKLTGNPKTSAVLLCLLVVALANNSNVMNAYVDITSGKASAYHRQVMRTYRELAESKKDTIQVGELSKRPLILPIRWPEKHNRLTNTIWEGYFNIKHVELD